ncbi:peptidoglycan DD-metalloendopeptidase family protein [Neisseria perflava]|uniref:peptidoglycan DD-metalloendopeptidase family protein n=1 Tax=Neisseria perflava TaxID=33053 RepID=UPI00209E049A|nr:peptidoglycan DD-metalloendopeptidase family protein [Neisseria perflava]MCP1659554.1 septal ring factor EnvC (AmiA/AmiB activator) [Neisseria perflava]MCP1772466.1 septal ring factor EnvC (AmiA/AmiB activator) [Neisseria perflava]
MRYKPLLLALMLCFSVPSFAANDTPKEKAAAAKKTVKTKKAAAEAAPKESSKKAATAKSSKKDSDGQDDTKKSAKSSKESKSSNKDKTSLKDKNTKAKAATEEQNDSKTGKSKKNAAAPKANKTAETKSETKAGKSKAKAADKVADDDNKKQTVKNSRAKSKTKDGDEAKEKKSVAKKSAAASSDSDELRAAVSAATNDLEEKKALNKRTEGFLVRVNANLKELQQTRLSLANINRQQRDAWAKLQKLDTDLSRLKAEVSNTRAQISRFVSGNYKNSQPNAVALFLKNAEPGQKTRFLRYTRYINAANEQVVKDLGKQQNQLAAQERKINAELGYLKKLQSNAQAALKKQGVNNSAEQAESRRQNAQMAKEAKQAGKRKDDEQRLNNLLSDLDKQKAEQRKKEAEQRKKAAEARLAAAEKARKAKAAEQKAAEERAAMSNLTEDDMKLQAPTSANYVAISSPNSFSRMQGRLKKPVNGLLSGLFGQPRSGGDVWKGVFYQTAPTAVSSIAAGTVVYAGSLEGYGNVVVVDHGDDYVSVYSGLSEITVAKGYNVGQGHKIGVSGSLPDAGEGLYLEIRYHGQNMNPLSWIS